MNYYVTRGGQQYGPYSLADLQRYVQAGNISPTDMARSEGMAQWLPVSQIIGNIAVAPQAPQAPVQPQSYGQVPVYSQPGAVAGQPNMAGGQPLPPGLHWAVVLLLAIVTCGIFSMVWMFIEANYVKKLRPQSNVMLLYAVGVAGFFCMGLLFASFSRSMIMLAPLLNIACAAALIVGHFQMKAALEEYYTTVEPINLHLSGVMVFFFNVFYFQYHFSRIREWKTTGVWR